MSAGAPGGETGAIVLNRALLILLVLLYAWCGRDGARGQVLGAPCPGQVCSTFSLQPLQAFESAFGGRLVKIAAYSATVCNYTPLQLGRSQGIVLQLAGTAAHINVVDFALQSSTAARAQAHSKLAITVSIFKWTSIGFSVGAAGATLFATQAKIQFPAKLTAGAAGGAAVFQGIQVPLNQAEQDAQQTGLRTLASMLNPQVMMSLPPSGCEEHGFFGEYVPKFQPITAIIQ